MSLRIPPDLHMVVVAREYNHDLWDYVEQTFISDYTLPDPNARDGEWHATITLPHEIVEQDGHAVPVFEGDIERQEWERRRRL